MAKTKIYPNMMKKYAILFADIFNDLRIPARNGTEIVVPIRMGGAERLIAMSQVLDETRNRINMTLPLMGFAIKSVEFDETRAYSMMHTLNSADKRSQIRQPVPYTINIELFLLCNRQGELFQIMEMILPMYQKARTYPMIEYKFLDGSQVKRDVPVELTSSAFEIKGDMSADDTTMYSSTLSFKVSGWLYNYEIEDEAKTIEHIDLKYEFLVDTGYANLNNKPISNSSYLPGIPFECTHITESTGGDINVDTDNCPYVPGLVTDYDIFSAFNSNANRILKGQAIYLSGFQSVDLAVGNADDPAQCFGLVYDSNIDHNKLGKIQLNGYFTMTDWTAVIGSPTLSPNTNYYLDPYTPGMITAIPPTQVGQYVTYIGRSLDNQTLILRIEQPIKL